MKQAVSVLFYQSNTMKKITILILASVSMQWMACTVAKVGVPAQFAAQADQLKVKGLNGFTFNQSLNFGLYTASEIKKGWDVSSKWQVSNISLRPEDMMIRLLNINTDRFSSKEKNKFQFTIRDEKLMADVFALEATTEKGKVYNTNTALGTISQRDQLNYDFSAIIVPYNFEPKETWKLVMQSNYDRKKDTARSIGDLPATTDNFYASNGKETITIHPLRITQTTSAKGKTTKIWGPGILSGYELRIDNGVIAVIDIVDPTVWLYKELDKPTKMIVSAIGSAILLKRKQDVQND